MMMRMLEAGGVVPLTDALREADVDNPGGYYELEDVKALDGTDTAWLDAARGRAVKVISALVERLPPSHSYRVVFMHRRLDEVIRSQRRMLEHRQALEREMDAGELEEFYVRHLAELSAWLDTSEHVEALHLNYARLIADPAAHARVLSAFLGGDPDPERMASVIDPSLYRNRSST